MERCIHMKFCFGDIVIVEDNLIGVIVKDWCSLDNEITHDVYVRYFSEIRTYKESQMERYMVRHKYLSGEEIIYQDNAINNRSIETSSNENKQLIILDTTIEDLLRKLEYAEPFIYKTNKVLKRYNIIRFKDLIAIEPYKLYKIYKLDKVQYSNLVAIILGICKNYNIRHLYELDDYYDKRIVE